VRRVGLILLGVVGVGVALGYGGPVRQEMRGGPACAGAMALTVASCMDAFPLCPASALFLACECIPLVSPEFGGASCPGID
jgi:hypothetical protein